MDIFTATTNSLFCAQLHLLYLLLLKIRYECKETNKKRHFLFKKSTDRHAFLDHFTSTETHIRFKNSLRRKLQKIMMVMLITVMIAYSNNTFATALLLSEPCCVWHWTLNQPHNNFHSKKLPTTNALLLFFLFVLSMTNSSLLLFYILWETYNHI